MLCLCHLVWLTWSGLQWNYGPERGHISWSLQEPWKRPAWGVRRFRDHLLFLPRSPLQPAWPPSVPWACFSNIPSFLCLRFPTTHPRSLQACLPGEQRCPSRGFPWVLCRSS